MSEREKEIIEAATKMHLKWMTMVNFHHPFMVSSNWTEAAQATKAERKVRDEYDEAFAHLTASCELYRQGR